MNKLNTTLLATMVLLLTSLSSQAQSQNQRGEEWQALFNGKNLDGWIAKFHHHETGVN